MPAAVRPKVGSRVTLIVLWTVVLLLGLGIGLLVGVQGLAQAVQSAATATAAASTIAVGVAVALVLLGLWGIAGSYRNLRHAVDLIAEVDRARTETIQLESTRYMSKGK